MGGTTGDPVEILQLQAHLRLVGDGEEMKDGIGRATEGHDRGDGVVEGRSRHDVPGTHVILEEPHHRLARSLGIAMKTRVDGGDRGGAGERHPDGLANRRHRVGGEHSRTGPRPGASGSLEFQELIDGDAALGLCADPLEHVHDRDVPPGVVAGKTRAAVEEDGGEIEPGRRHQHPG